MQFQLKRLEELNLQPGEMDLLESERVRLTEQSQSREAFDKALVALSGGEENASDQIRLPSTRYRIFPTVCRRMPRLSIVSKN